MVIVESLSLHSDLVQDTLQKSLECLKVRKNISKTQLKTKCVIFL